VLGRNKQAMNIIGFEEDQSIQTVLNAYKDTKSEEPDNHAAQASPDDT
jgi:hypothetical protein